jgi:CHAT domain-containing protein
MSFDKIGQAPQRGRRKPAMLFRRRKSPRWLYSAVVVILFLAAPPPTADPQTPLEATIRKAKHLAWLNNWAEAARVLDQLDRHGLGPLDEETALFARAAQVRGNIERLSLPAAADEVTSMLDSNAAKANSELRLYLLSIKGDIEFQYDLPAAQKTWEEARQLASGVGRSQWKARAEGELGTIAFLNGEIYSAVSLVSRALLKAEVSRDVAAQIRYRTALGEGLAEFGRPADAIRFYSKALTLAEGTESAYFPFTAYLGKARLLAATGHTQEGHGMLREGLLDARRKNLRVREARILTVLGELASARGDHHEAVQRLSAAAEVARSAGLDRIEADASSALASRLREIGNIAAAAAHARRGVAAARRARDVYHLPQMLAILAEVEASNRDFAVADATYSQAADLVHALLRGFPHPKHKNTLIATMSRVFQGHFALAVDGFHDLAKAFTILESAKALSLVDLIRASNTRHVLSPWDEKSAQRVAVLQRTLSAETDPVRRSALLDRLWELEVRSFRPPTPSAAGAQSLPMAKPISLQQLRTTLADGELLIEFVLGSSRSFALAISRDRVAHYELRERRVLESAVELHLGAIRRQRDSRAEARTLYRLLLEPLVPLLSQSKRLVIVPDGKLHLAAFGALLDPAGRYLVDTHVISYAPSATAYHLLSTRIPDRTIQARVLGVGGAHYSLPRFGEIQSSFRRSRFFDTSGAPRWSAIPQSLAEVNDLANSGLGKPLLLTGDEAAEADLKRLPLSIFRVLHFALHSTIDDEFPDRSALVLSANRRNKEDDLLQAREILDLSLNADLVTLSACDAGAGTVEGIAGMNSLVQAFLMAGSRSVVASVWPAEDMFTASLMRRFYANLQKGFDKAEALTLAKRELLRMNGPDALPFLWAGFRLVGDAHGTVPGE